MGTKGVWQRKKDEENWEEGYYRIYPHKRPKAKEEKDLDPLDKPADTSYIPISPTEEV